MPDIIITFTQEAIDKLAQYHGFTGKELNTEGKPFTKRQFVKRIIKGEQLNKIQLATRDALIRAAMDSVPEPDPTDTDLDN